MVVEDFRDLLDGQIGNLFAPQNSTRIATGHVEHGDIIRPVAYQAARLGIRPERVDSRNPLAGRQCDDFISCTDKERVRAYYNCDDSLFRKQREVCLRVRLGPQTVGWYLDRKPVSVACEPSL